MIGGKWKEREGWRGERERGGVGEGGKSQSWKRGTEGRMIRAKMLDDGEGPRTDG
jgi:hypothetical protein